MSTVSFDHVGLSVADLDRQRRFYVEAFDFHEEHHTEISDPGIRIALLSSPDGTTIELTERAGSVPQRFAGPIESAGIQGYFHWALTVDDLDGTIAAAVAGGARTITQPTPARRPGIRFAYLADPEGNLIELLQRTR